MDYGSDHDENVAYDGHSYGSSTPSSSARRNHGGSYVPSLTIPVSPNFATARRGKYESELISTDQRRLMELQERQEQFRRDRELAERRKQKSLYGAPLLPARSEKPLTEPQEFSFATTSRFGNPRLTQHVQETPPSVKKRKMSETQHMTVTVPEPFNFASEARLRKRREAAPSLDNEMDMTDTENGMMISTPNSQASQGTASSRKMHQKQTSAPSPWVPLKEKMRRMEMATPEHWKKEAKPRSPVRVLELTRPQEPILHTAVRSHSRPEASTQQAELEKKSSSHSFKAHPLNPRILQSSGDLGVMRVAKRPLTQPQSPKLRVAALASRRPTAEELREREEREAAMKRQFRALPVNGALPAESPRRSVHQPRQLTVAASPLLHTKQRSAVHVPKQVKEETPKRAFKARPMPLPPAPAYAPQVAYQPPKLTIPEPFALHTEERSAYEAQKRQEAKEREEREAQEARKFKARPLPLCDAPFRPLLELKITDPEPFTLRSELLHESSLRLQQEKQAQEEAERKAKMAFKARPLPLQQHPPHSFKRSSRPLTEITEFTLNTENRSQQRQQFEINKNAKEAQARALEERRIALDAERQKQEIKALRQKLVHKPTPLPGSVYRQTTSYNPVSSQS